jgi:hypothetical protein
MNELDRFHRSALVAQVRECFPPGVIGRSAQRSATASMKRVGRPHSAQIADEIIQAPVPQPYPIEIDHRLDEAANAQQPG